MASIALKSSKIHKKMVLLGSRKMFFFKLPVPPINFASPTTPAKSKESKKLAMSTKKLSHKPDPSSREAPILTSDQHKKKNRKKNSPSHRIRIDTIKAKKKTFSQKNRKA
jgi:hypothetical protein